MAILFNCIILFAALLDAQARPQKVAEEPDTHWILDYVGANTNLARTVINGWQNVANGGLHLLNQTAATSARVASKVSDTLTSAGKHVVKTVCGFQKTILQAGTNTTNAGLCLVETAASLLPVVKQIVGTSVKVSKSAVDNIQARGEKGIGKIEAVAERKMELVDNIVKAGTGLVEKVASNIVNSIGNGVNLTATVANAGIDAGEEYIEAMFNRAKTISENPTTPAPRFILSQERK